LHNFSGPSSLKIDHSLGKKLFEISELVYQEPAQLESTTSTVSLSKIVSQETWQTIANESKKIFFELGTGNEAEKVALHKQFLAELEVADPVSAYVNLDMVSNLKRKKSQPNLRSYPGLSSILQALNNQTGKNKIIYIEDGSAVDTSWRKNCNSQSKAEVILKAGIDSMTSGRTYEETDTMKTQGIFFGNDLNAMINDFTSSPFALTINECVINPRNLNWMLKISNLLETKGPPVSIVVGIGHVVGDKGLLELLKAKGYTDIKRVYEIKP
jgi:hypothetical protein